MKIISKSEIVEFPETIEEGPAQVLCDKPYQIERLVTNQPDEVIMWYGYNVNWKKEDGQWYELILGEFVPCDIPEYEKEYLKINKN